jgi:hypothetical protein
MSISNEIKKNITKDWLGEFPELSAFAQNKLYKILGPILIGIEIFKQPRADDYRPYFVSYPLWEIDIKKCLEEPIILQEMRNKKGLQFDIPYLKHTNFFPEVIECTKKQVQISFNKDVQIENLFEVINSQLTHTLIKSSPVQQAELYKFKFFVTLYIGDVSLINKVLDEIKEVGKNWLPNLFEWKYGKYDTWLQGVREKINQREEFLKQITTNKQDNKLKKLKSSELTA